MSSRLGLHGHAHHLHHRRETAGPGPERNRERTGHGRCSSLASKSYQAATTGLLSATHSWERHSSPTSDQTLLPRHAERAGGETKQIWQVSSTFCWVVCTATSPPPPTPLALSRCCKTGADNFRFLHSEWHVNKPAHQSQQSSVTRQRSLTPSPVTQNPTN